MKLILLMLLQFVTIQLFSQNIKWAYHFGSIDPDYGDDIITDTDNNVYMVGRFGDTPADFDAGSGYATVTINDYYGLVLVKYTSNGEFCWVRLVEEGAGLGSLAKLAIDEDKNIYVWCADYEIGFFAKYNQFGDQLWINYLNPVGITNCFSGDIYTKDNDILITGGFAGTFDFDPTANNYFLTYWGRNDGFIAKYDTDGNFKWAKRLGGYETNLVTKSIVMDDEHNIYLGGRFDVEADFNTSETEEYIITGAPQWTGFIAKYSEEGDFMWVDTLEYNGISEVTTDHDENVLVGGLVNITKYNGNGERLWRVWKNSNDLCFDNENAIIAIGGDQFFKLDPSGKMLWYKEFTPSGIGGASGQGIQMDLDGNIVLTGNFSGRVDFDPDEGQSILLAPGDEDDAFFVKYLKDPVIEVFYQDNPISIGDTITIHPINEHSHDTIPFVITNTGNGEVPLFLTGDPIIALSGDDSTEFEVITQPVSVLESNESTSFDILFSPVVAGLKEVRVLIENNDEEHQPFEFLLHCQVLDITPPEVTDVRSQTPDGYYNAGDTILINITFNENVFVEGIPILNLETGQDDHMAYYFEGSGTNELIFRYVVEEGDSSQHLSYISDSALNMEGASICDLSGNMTLAQLPFPGDEGSLFNNSNIIIDTDKPMIFFECNGLENKIFNCTLTFSERIVGFNLEDLQVQNGFAGNLDEIQDSISWDVQIMPIESSMPTIIFIAGNAVRDLADNGNIEMEEIVGYSGPDQSTVSLLPNPVKDILYVKLNKALKSKSPYSLRLYNMFGRLCREEDGYLELDQPRFLKLNLGDLDVGMYVLEITFDQIKVSDKIVIR